MTSYYHRQSRRRWSFRLKDKLEDVYWDLHEGKDIKRNLNILFDIVLDRNIDNDIESIRGLQSIHKSETPL